MNTIELCGGLGNQLFQYAFGRAQMENGIDVKYNLSWYRHLEKKYPRPYQLGKFCIDMRVGSFTRKKIFREGRFNLSLLKRDNCNFKGYWQYYGYHENVLPILKEEFQVKEEFHTEEFLSLQKKIVSNNSVSIHVRRGDYVGHKRFGALPFRYYINALSASKVKGDLFIFSDDIPWCIERFKQNYFSRKVTFVRLEEYLDFELMKLCKHNIISNSSFSWWAAYLNNNPEKIVIAPVQTQWLKDSWTNIVEKRYPEDWIKM